MRRCTNILHAVKYFDNKYIEVAFNSKGLYFFKKKYSHLNADVDANANADADAEMLMPRLPSGLHFDVNL